MSGFRLARGGAQERFNIKPDLTTLGKIIGGGMPVGAYGGRKEIMDFVSPVGPVYQAGTVSGNPVAMSAGLAMLHYLNDHKEVYEQLESISAKIVKGMEEANRKAGYNFTINRIGSMFTLFFTDQPVTDFESAKKSDLKKFASYFQSMLAAGTYMAPSQFESLFISAAVDEKIADKIIEAHKEAINFLK